MKRARPYASPTRLPYRNILSNANSRKPLSLRERLFIIVFEADTRAGRQFDQMLLYAILLSLVVVMLDSVQSISSRHAALFAGLEWLFTGMFTLEYLVRIYCAKRRWRYALSFYGLVDLLAILPTYLALFRPELNALLAVRVLRMLRVFRVFKLNQYLSEVTMLAGALSASRRKIFVFLCVVLMVVMVMGTIMYVVEGPENGFTSIPVSIYWAVTTMTTVGFGDIAPKTDLGRLISSIMMLMGWGTLAVPTGIVTSEMAFHRGKTFTTRVCGECMTEGLGAEDNFCRHCGTRLPAYVKDESAS